MEHKNRTGISFVLQKVSSPLKVIHTVPVACKAHRTFYYDIAFLSRPRPCASKGKASWVASECGNMPSSCFALSHWLSLSQGELVIY